MRTATAVIGANYGDEGKGLVVDALAGGSDTVVVRFNGGAQAGHTVVTPEGRRHVFHHHGAGAFRGAATYLSEDFILNPILFQQEHITLDCPHVLASPICRVTTPYDMMLNQWVEQDRTQRHGSCGLGINETIQRYIKFKEDRDNVRDQLNAVRYEYLPIRIEELGIQMTKQRWQLVNSETIVEQFIDAYEMMCTTIWWITEPSLLTEVFNFEHIIFEGAQGLLLDRDAPDFPHVTNSKTGLHNVRQLCTEMDIEELDAVYCTRTYMTRHGAGPFPTEEPTLRFDDQTNVSNAWQHSLRFGFLDVPKLFERITEDAYDEERWISPRLAITCVDQMDNELLRDSCPFPIYESHGPTRATFKQYATKP